MTSTLATSTILTLRAALDANPGDVTLACMLADEMEIAGYLEGAVVLARLDRVPFFYGMQDTEGCPFHLCW